jgi:hypothetical protein
MADKVPVKANFTGSDVTSLGEFASTDTIPASYINGIPTGTLPLAGGTMTGALTVNAAAVFNELGADIDFRVESDTLTHALFVQGSDGQVGIGKVPIRALDIKSTGDTGVRLETNSASMDVLTLRNSTGTLDIGTGLKMKSAGGLIGFGHTNTDTTNTGNVTLDFSANQNFVLTLTGNVTLANPTTEQVGQSGFIAFIQDGTGSRTVGLGTDYETAGAAGLTLTATASATDLVPYLVVASGRILLGTPQLAFA